MSNAVDPTSMVAIVPAAVWLVAKMMKRSESLAVHSARSKYSDIVFQHSQALAIVHNEIESAHEGCQGVLIRILNALTTKRTK